MKITRDFLRELQSEAHRQAQRYKSTDLRKEYWDKMYNCCIVLLHQDTVYKYENIEKPSPTPHDIFRQEQEDKRQWMKRAVEQSRAVSR